MIDELFGNCLVLRSIILLILHPGGRLGGPQPSRGPSTPEERTSAILLTRHLENEPLSLDASDARAWLST
jgi:hypothetical protein